MASMGYRSGNKTYAVMPTASTRSRLSTRRRISKVLMSRFVRLTSRWAGITGGGAIFCIPAQQTIPLLIRWMLVFEDEDEDHLHFGRALPRDWVASGKPIAILGAPTRWGRVDYRLETSGANTLVTVINLPAKGALPKELHVTFRIPAGRNLAGATVN